MKRVFEIALGIITGIGGFLEAGSLATAAQAGADYRFQLGWSILLGSICLAFLCEMSGRFSAISKHTIPDALRERFGFPFFLVPLGAVLVVMLLVLMAELGGVALALQLATGVRYSWWILPIAITAWLILWRGTFGLVEKGVSMLGLLTLVFVVAALKLDPPYGEIARGLVPSLPSHQPAHYWFVAVSILGASISPYLFFFYSSGAVEDRWDVSYLGINRVTAGAGMGFGGVVAIAAMVVAAMVFGPRGIHVDRYEQIGLLLPAVMGRAGFWLFVGSLAVACFGAALELALTIAYTLAQGFGWEWSENQPPASDARFSSTYTAALLLASLPMLAGLDLLKLTVFGMALTAVALPLTILPFLLLMNDPTYVREYRNGWLGNLVVGLIVLLACVTAVVAIPLQIIGGS
jgi:Mn2+/Fe2+ NRAMP family transporter